MNLTPLERKKFTLWFEMMDRDNDGFLTRRDFELAAESWNRVLGHKPGSDEYVRVASYWADTWESLKMADTDDDGKVSLDEYLEVNATARQADGYSDYVRAWTQTTLDAFDVDRDGAITLAEWKRIYSAHGLSEEMAERTFSLIEADGDGVLSFEEYHQRAQEYTYNAEGSAPGDHFWGVVDYETL